MAINFGIVAICLITFSPIVCVPMREQIAGLRTANEPEELDYCKSECQKKSNVVEVEQCLCTHQCYPEKYWAISRRCEPCSPLCEDAKARGSEERCRRKCPKYCPRDAYWEDATRKCEQCGPLCEEAQARGQEARCLDKCPDYTWMTFTADMTFSTAFQQHSIQNEISPGVWAAIIVVFCIVIVLVLILMEKRSHSTREKQLKKNREQESQLLPAGKITDARTVGIVRQEQGPHTSKVVPTGFKDIQNSKAIAKSER